MQAEKLLVRAALRLSSIYRVRAGNAIEQKLLDRLSSYQLALKPTRAVLRQAAAEGWPAACPQVRRCLLGLRQAVADAADQIGEDLNKPAPPVPDLRSLVEELRQLDREFGGIQVDLKHKTVQVTTEPIELEGVYLGPFAVQLSMTRLASDPGWEAFAIVALQPHPAASDEAVTHPHVRHGTLCAGDAKVPIQRALKQGRIADAFCLVHGVLAHYNPRSPHVALEAWGGNDCYECGCTADDLCYCEHCGHDYCSECVESCGACGATRCGSCLSRCERCQAGCCSGCLVRAAASGKRCCPKCRAVPAAPAAVSPVSESPATETIDAPANSAAAVT